MAEIESLDRFLPVEEAERRIIATGAWRGTLVEFSNDGETWRDAWLPTDDHPVPRLARATVHREGLLIPTTVVVSWSEYYPDDNPERAAAWDRLKTMLLRKVAKMAAYREAFRDVIGEAYEPAEMDQATPPAPPARDWVAEVIEADSRAAVMALHAEARTAKQLTDSLGVLIADRLNELPEPQVEKRPMPKPVRPTPKRPPRG